MEVQTEGINKYDAENKHINESINQNSIEEKLPNEMIQKVISFLSDEDLQSTMILNSHWKALTLDQAKIDRFLPIKESVKFLLNNLDPEKKKLYQEEIEDLIKNDEFTSIKEIRLIENKLTEIINKIYKTHDLISLENIPQHIRVNAIINKIIPIINKTSIDNQQIKIRELALVIANMGSIDKSIDLLKKNVTDNSFLDESFKVIARKLAENRNLKGAIKVASQLRDHPDDTLFEISKELLSTRRPEDALFVAERMKDTKLKDLIFQDFSLKMSIEGKTTKARKAANKITDPEKKGESLYYICTNLHKKEKILEIEKNIDSPHWKTRVKVLLLSKNMGHIT